MKKKPYLISILLLTFALLFSSCTVTQNFYFSSSNPLSGKSNSNITADDFFIEVMNDLSSWTEDSSSAVENAVENFEQNLKDSKKARNIDFHKTGENTFSGTFSFDSFEELLKALSSVENQDILKVTPSKKTTKIEFSINMDNYPTLAKIVPILSDPNFEVYGPLYNNYLQEEDYLDMIAFILGEDGPQSIKNSNITIRIQTPRPIQKTNAKKVNSNTLEFTFPLIEFLLLHNGIYFWCEF